MHRYLRLSLVILLSLLFLAACGRSSKDINVEIEMTELRVTDKGDKLIIKGETNLLNGANLVYDLTPTEFEYDIGLVEGYIEVKDNEFNKEVDITEFDNNIELEVWLAFAPLKPSGDQPENIYEVYGEAGDKITSESGEVWESPDGEVKSVSIETTIIIE